MKIQPSNQIKLSYNEYLEKNQSFYLIFSFYIFHILIILNGIILKYYNKLNYSNNSQDSEDSKDSENSGDNSYEHNNHTNEQHNHNISLFTFYRLISIIPIILHLYYYIQKYYLYNYLIKLPFNVSYIGSLYIFIITITSSFALLSSSLNNDCNMVLCDNINKNNLQPFLLFQNIIIPVISPILVKTHYITYVFIGLLISFVFSITSAIIVHAAPPVYYGIGATYFLVAIVLLDHEKTLCKLYQNYLDQEEQFLLRYSAQCEAELSLKKEDEMKQILGNITADLKSPLHTLKNELDGLLNQYSDNPILFESMHKLNSISSYIFMILQRNIDYSKVLSGVPLLPAYDLIHLEDCIESVITNASYTTKSIPIYLDPIPDNISTYITTDKRWFQDNILSLLTNALKLSLRGSIIVRCNLVSSSSLPLSIPLEYSSYLFDSVSEFIKIEVEHLGGELNSQNYSDLFQLSFGLNENFGESGLGLYSIYKRVEVLGGICGGNHRSDGLSGANFWFCIPYHPDSILSPLTSVSFSNYRHDQSYQNSIDHNHHLLHSYNNNNSNNNNSNNYPHSSNINSIDLTPENNNIQNNINNNNNNVQIDKNKDNNINENEDDDNDEEKGEEKGNIEKKSKLYINYKKEKQNKLKLDENIEKKSLDHRNIQDEHKSYEMTYINNNNIGNNHNIGNNIKETSLLLCNQSESSFVGKSILIVDDSILIQKATTEILFNEGFEVSVAKHGKECIQMIQKNRYDYILMDIQMPIMNGMETTIFIRQYEMEWLTPSLDDHLDEELGDLNGNITYNRHIIIGFITEQNDEMIKKLLSIGMDDVIYKPLDIKLFYSCIKKLENVNSLRTL